MKRTRVTEKFDSDGKMIERITVIEETQETAPGYQPYPLEVQPYTPPSVQPYPRPHITWNCVSQTNVSVDTQPYVALTLQ